MMAVWAADPDAVMLDIDKGVVINIQIGDILVQKQVPESAKRKIDLWTG